MIWSLAAIVKLILSVLIVPLAALVVAVTSVPRISSSVRPWRRAWRDRPGRGSRAAVAEDRDLGDAGHLRDLLAPEDVGIFVDRRSAAECRNAPRAAGSAHPPD